MRTTFCETKSAVDLISVLNLKLQILRIAAGCWPNKEHCGQHVGKKNQKEVSQGVVEKNHLVLI